MIDLKEIIGAVNFYCLKNSDNKIIIASLLRDLKMKTKFSIFSEEEIKRQLIDTCK